MRAEDIAGVACGKRVFTTQADETAPHPDDLVGRDFTAPAPNRLWVAGLTYVRILAGFVYGAFAFDLFSRLIVGRQATSHLRTDLALEMALWQRREAGKGLIHDSDRGCQYPPPPRFATPSGSRRPASRRPSAPAATAATTRSPGA